MLLASPIHGDMDWVTRSRTQGKRQEAQMNRILSSMFAGGLIVLAMAATAVAAEPSPSPGTQVQARDTVPAILGLTQQQIMDLRHDGQSLAQIAESKSIDPATLVAALEARWAERIDVRVANGGLTADAAAALRDQLELRARDLVYRVTTGGMQGLAVGAGHGQGNGAANGQGNGAANGQGNGAANGGRNGATQGAGSGTCDGTGPHGPGRR
jgi:hypothetical protein